MLLTARRPAGRRNPPFPSVADCRGAAAASDTRRLTCQGKRACSRRGMWWWPPRPDSKGGGVRSNWPPSGGHQNNGAKTTPGGSAARSQLRLSETGARKVGCRRSRRLPDARCRHARSFRQDWYGARENPPTLARRSGPEASDPHGWARLVGARRPQAWGRQMPQRLPAPRSAQVAFSNLFVKHSWFCEGDWRGVLSVSVPPPTTL